MHVWDQQPHWLHNRSGPAQQTVWSLLFYCNLNINILKIAVLLSAPTFTCKGSAVCVTRGEMPSCPNTLEPHAKACPSSSRHRLDLNQIRGRLIWWHNHLPVRIRVKSQPQDTTCTLLHPGKGQGWKVMTSEVCLSPNWPLLFCPHISSSPDSVETYRQREIVQKSIQNVVVIFLLSTGGQTKIVKFPKTLLRFSFLLMTCHFKYSHKLFIMVLMPSHL